MSLIHRLDPQTANRIAAGEVVERPASVVKEVCENALDAKANIITIEVSGGGLRSLIISDNGFGMDAEDAELAFVAHATSKLKQIEDLDALDTMGFRGEALASIASVSDLDLLTKRAEDEVGVALRFEAGRLVSKEPAAAPVGTKIAIFNLFYNTPARLKFMKKDSTEMGKITETVQRLALSRPDVSFKLLNEGRQILHSPGNNDLASTVFALFGKNIAKDLLELPSFDQEDAVGEAVRVSGLIGQPGQAKNSRNWQYLFVNDRFVRSPAVSRAIDEAYRGRLMKGKYPFVLLNLRLPQNLVDINVHPQKMEVRFWNAEEVFRAVYHSVRSALEMGVLPPGDWGSADSQVLTGKAFPHYLPAEGRENNRHDPLQQLHQLHLPEAGFLPLKQEQENGPLFREDMHAAVAPSEGKVVAHHRQDEEGEGDEGGDLLQSSEARRPFYPPVDLDAPKEQVLDAKRLTDPVSHPLSPEALPIPSSPPVSKAYRPVIGVDDHDVARRLSSLPIVGQAFGTYIILQDEDTLWLLDQHAAHEKILFERLYHAYLQGNRQVEDLLVPIPLDLDEISWQQALDQQELLRNLGYEFESFGERSLLLRAVPADRQEMQVVEGFWAALHYLSEELHLEGESFSERQAYDILAEMACKAAIKGRRDLSHEEIHALLLQLERLHQPYNCPHGRPVVIRLSRYELEKRFKRIVT